MHLVHTFMKLANVIKRTLSAVALIAVFAGAAFSARAEVKLNALFSNGMVLQRGVKVPVWGTAHDGEKVTVKFQDQTVTTTAEHGRWIVYLKSLQAGGPFTLSVMGDNTVSIGNVLVGE